jgi:membrane protease YdiL (CAAX protease family)
MPGVLFLAIGGIGPAISAIFLTYVAQGADQQKDYWKRVIGFNRIPLKWYAVIFLIPPVYSVLALVTGLVLQKSLPSLETPANYLHNPLSILPFAAVTLFYGPLPEELGWRGYALDRLQSKWNALTASIILGIIWSIWHTPMFFMKESLQADVFPLGTLRFWIAMGPGILAEAVIMTWIYNNTRRSILSAILFHFMMNFTGEFLRLPGDFKSYQFLWLILIAIAVIILYGPTKLARKHPGGSKSPI